jgi:hypothetical protein
MPVLHPCFVSEDGANALTPNKNLWLILHEESFAQE